MVTYRVQAVRWNFLPDREGALCDLEVDRELHFNPCTKCGKRHFSLLPLIEGDAPNLSEIIVGWECAQCNYPLHNDGKPKPPPDPNFRPYTGPTP